MAKNFWITVSFVEGIQCFSANLPTIFQRFVFSTFYYLDIVKKKWSPEKFGVKKRPLESSNESTTTSVSSNFRLVPSG